MKQTGSLLVAGFSCQQHKDDFFWGGGGGRDTIVEIHFCPFIVTVYFFSGGLSRTLYFCICFCLILRLVKLKFLIRDHSNAIKSALRAGIVLLFVF